MKIINLFYSIIRKSFESSQDGGNTYLSSLLLFSWFAFGTFYNIIFSFLLNDLTGILGMSFILSLMTPIFLFIYPGYEYKEDVIANLTGFKLQVMSTVIVFFFLGTYFLTAYLAYVLYF
jgi:hypothetical protein